jgi:hypothetical protein
MTGFQTIVNRQPAPAIEGDWASANPKFSLVAGAGALTAGANIMVGRFAWADEDGVVNLGGNGRLGFVQKDNLSTIPLNINNGFGGIAQSTLQVVQGTEMALISNGDVWARFAAGAIPNQMVFANFADGTAFSAPAGSPTGSTSTASTIAPETSAFTASIANGGILDVTAVSSGTIYPGTIISGSGSITNNQIEQQLTGTPGGVGLYQLAFDDGTVVTSESFTGSYGLLTIGGTVTGTFPIGAVLTGSGVTAGTSIFANSSNGVNLTGAGGAGTYVVSPSQTIGTAQAINSASNVQTAWFVETFAAAGELAIISQRG